MGAKKQIGQNDEVKLKKEENWKTYLRISEKNIDKALERRDYAIKQFDTLMIALSTAGLGFTSSYIKDDVGDLLLARISQLIFLGCLISTLLSHIFSMWANNIGYKSSIKEFEVDCYGEEHVENFNKGIYLKNQRKARRQVIALNSFIRLLNILSFGSLITAISLFVKYSFTS